MATCTLATGWPDRTPAHAAVDALNFFLSAPGVQGSFVPGVTLETFDSRSGILGSSTVLNVGTISAGSISVIAADPTGASSTNSTAVPYGTSGYTKYARVLANNSATITLGSSLNYLGFWWAAGDANSTIEMYDGSTLVADFSTSDITTLIPKGVGNTVTAYGGGVYNNNDYYGARGSALPNYALNVEPFAYVHSVAPAGTTFNKIKLIQGPSGGFELDNLTVGTYTGTFNTTGLVGFGLANDTAVDDSFTVVAGQTLTDTLAGNDTMLGSSTFSKDTSPSLGSATVSSSGALTFVAGSTAGTTTFTYKLCRTISSCVTATVTITITAAPTTSTSASTTSIAPGTTTLAPTTTLTSETGTLGSEETDTGDLSSSGYDTRSLLWAALGSLAVGLATASARRRIVRN